MLVGFALPLLGASGAVLAGTWLSPPARPGRLGRPLSSLLFRVLAEVRSHFHAERLASPTPLEFKRAKKQIKEEKSRRRAFPRLGGLCGDEPKPSLPSPGSLSRCSSPPPHLERKNRSLAKKERTNASALTN